MRFSFPCLVAPLALAAALAFTGCSDSDGEPHNPFDNEELDTTPPSTPAGLAITPTETTLVVEWDDNSEADFAGYVLEKSIDRGNNWNTIPGLLLTSQFEDVYAARADYRVRAQDLIGNESANSPTITYLQPTEHGPKTPANPQ